MNGRHAPSLVLLGASVLAACSTVATPGPTATADCGPLETSSCEAAFAVALKQMPEGHSPILAMRITDPSAGHTCPPSGGPAPDPHVCEVIAVVSTATGDFDFGLIRGSGSWIWAGTIE